MHDTLKRAWITALRSGEYRQGRNYLHADDTFCCFGVLCELHRQYHAATTPGVQWRARVLSFRKTVMTYEGKDGVLPLSVGQWVGLTNLAQWDVLTTMNDRGDTFAQIADYIEEYL